MKSRLARIRDYFWTKGVKDGVVTGVVLSVLGSLWLWGQSGFSSNAGIAWAGAKSTLSVVWCWLVSPSGVPRGIVWLLALIASALVLYIARPLIRALIKDLKPRRGVVVDPQTLQVLKEAATKHLEAIQARLAVPQTKATESVLSLLVHAYPDSVEISEIADKLPVTYVAAEKLAEAIEAAGLLKISKSDRSAVLSTQGRDYCHAHGLDLV